METKICKKCQEIKNISQFGKNNRNKDKLSAVCKSCDNLRSKIYRLKNKEKIKELNSKYYKSNKSKVLSKSKEYYLLNRNDIINKNKKYYFDNIDVVKITKKKYFESHKEQLNLKSKEWSTKNRKLLSQKDKERRHSDHLFRTIRYVRNRINKFLKSKNYKKNSKSFNLVGCSPDFFRLYIENQFTEGMSWELMGTHIHIDHKIPLSSGKNEDEVNKLCHYTNLQPLWAKDNLIKGKK